MAHVAHVVDAVEVGGSCLVEHVLALGPHHLQRVLLEEELAGGPNVLLSQLGGAFFARHVQAREKNGL